MDQNLEIIKSVVREVFPECRIVLFGSRAREDNAMDSDYDILVLIPQQMEPVEKLPYRTMIRKKLLEVGVFSDILIQGLREAEVKKKLPGHIIRSAMKEGVYL